MEKIKVAHVLNSVGGLDVWVRLTLDAINSERFENVIVHGTEDTNHEFLDEQGNPVKEYKVVIKRNLSLWHDIRAIIFAYKTLKKEKPDLIHAHSAKGGVIGRIAGRLLGIPVMYTPHAFSYLSTDASIKKFIFIVIEKLLANGNSVLVATSASEYERGVNEVGYMPKKAVVLNNSINPISNLPPLTIPKTWPDTYICTVARPSYQKNIELMLHAVSEIKKHHSIHLLLLGVGIVQDRIGSVLSLIDTLNLKNNVTLIEWTNRQNVLKIVSEAKVYISTSRYEGMPYAVLESLALGIPGVVSNCDGNKDLIVDNYNGYIINSENPMDYAQKIMALLNNDNLLQTFSVNAKMSFEENYNLSINIKKLEQIYTSYARTI